MNDTTVWCQNASVTEPQREVVPKRLRELIYCQRSKATACGNLYCTNAFTKCRA